MKGDHGGFAVDRYTHCLQTATRAMRDGRDEEYIVCALLHDIGDTLAPANHADFAATMLEPFISSLQLQIFPLVILKYSKNMGSLAINNA